MASKNAPLISVVIPTYNRADKLFKAVESVLNQSIQDFELIIVDDGSQDDTYFSLLPYLDSKKLRYFCINNSGPAIALNHGISLARGKYLSFLDSDDEYYIDHLKVLTTAIEQDNLDFVIGSFDLINHSKEIHEVVDFYDSNRTISLNEIECITGILFVKREKMLQMGGFKSDFPDTDLFDRMKKKNFRWKKVFTPTYKYNFGIDSMNLSKELFKKYLVNSKA